MLTLPPGADLRAVEYRREVFLRFYDFHTRYGTHPGLVYLLIPGLAERCGWTSDETLWFAFLNGCTQHPPSTWIMHRRFPSHRDAAGLLAWLPDHIDRLAVDTDRRHHRRAIPAAVEGYLRLLGGEGPPGYWQDRAAEGWGSVWAAARAIPTFGRLSAWSFCDYLLCSGIPVEPASLLLEDRAGSRSHRNGLAIVSGRDDLDWHASNPGFDGHYPPSTLAALADVGESLLADARARAAGLPHARFVNRLTLESALCTYKSWHRPRRRYPNVYADMLHDRLLATERAWPDEDFDLFWQVRADRLPARLRLEDNPGDPGVHPLKQDWYRLTGEVPVLSAEHADMTCEFDAMVAAQAWGRFR